MSLSLIPYNIILKADSYKYSMYRQLPPKTLHCYSYIESRGGRWDRTLMFGLQIILKEIAAHPVTLDAINDAERIITAHGEPFNRAGWEYILFAHGGRLPLSIYAVPEGTVVNGHNVLVSVVNTDHNVLVWDADTQAHVTLPLDGQSSKRNVMVEQFRNGRVMVEYRFADIRARAHQHARQDAQRLVLAA